MGLFSFLKRNQPEQEEEQPKEKYWSLTTNDGEVIDPTWEQIEAAVKNANPDESIFATLAYNHSELEIEAIQVLGEENVYRFEALPPSNEEIYVTHDVSYEDTLRLFRDFYKYEKVFGFRSWPTV